jgi:quercetin dioxygenase-like cupin family protein
MSEQTNEPQPTVGQKIDQFIAAVDRTLAEGGMAEDERQNVVGDLRVQIEEMLLSRTSTSGNAATLADVEAVLAELDPPESYSQGEPTKETPKSEPAEQTRAHSCGQGHARWRRGGPYWFWKKRRVADAVRRAIHSFSPFGHPAFMGMTDRARNAMGLAKSEARRMQHDFIGTEHLLLGLILEGTGVAGKVLAGLGVTVDRARVETARLVGPGTSAVLQERLPLTPRLRHAIEEARLQAHTFGHDYLGTEHLLLGLLDIPAVAPQVLKNLGLNIDDVRQEILRQIPMTAAQASSTSPPPGPAVTYWPAGAAQAVKIGPNQYRVIASGSDTGGVFTAIEATLAASDDLGPRKHTREDISLYVIEGALRVSLQDRLIELSKGDFLRVPRGVQHDIQPATESARVQLIATPGGYERALVALSQATTIEAKREVATQAGILS